MNEMTFQEMCFMEINSELYTCWLNFKFLTIMFPTMNAIKSHKIASTFAIWPGLVDVTQLQISWIFDYGFYND